jgi:hypothetical protein
MMAWHLRPLYRISGLWQPARNVARVVCLALLMNPSKLSQHYLPALLAARSGKGFWLGVASQAEA